MKTVLITGGSGGIGERIALEFGKQGYKVCIHCNSSVASAESTAETIRAMGSDAAIFKADIASEAEIKKMFAEIKIFCGGVDVLVNNAGMSMIKLISDTSCEEWDRLFSVNTRSQFLCAKEAIPYMISKKQGRIINVSSMWGVSGASCEVAYSASKAAVIGFTKALAKELAPSNITVNCIAPGLIDTKMNSSLSDEDKQALREETPMGRLGIPEDIARTVLFLADDKADFITGQTINCDGGFTL